jgi:uncharacterized protein
MSVMPSLNALIADLSEGADEVIETSCAVVILKGQRAYKLKKSVNFGFLDFTTQAKRKTALLCEYELNQRTAKDIYLGLETHKGETVLIMRRFDTKAVLNERVSEAKGLEPDLMIDLGHQLAQFHHDSAPCQDTVHLHNLDYVIQSNAQNIALFYENLGDLVDTYDRLISQALDGFSSQLKTRFEEGFVRQCHGDLHLGNILIEDSKPVLFDCIEFNERLSQIDILYDFGFLLMDLWVRGEHASANLVFNSYCEATARLDPGRAYEGLQLLPLFMSVRAAVRCHVSAHNKDLIKARTYLEAAIDFLKPKTISLTLVGGLSGSGKSVYAKQIACALGTPPGAVILRKDEIRKRLWGLKSLDTLPLPAYTLEVNKQVSSHILSLIEPICEAGQSVIIDATFIDQADASEAKALAKRLGVGFQAFWMEVPEAERLKRVSMRVKDVSDATLDVAASQSEPELLSDTWKRQKNY